MQTAGFWPAVLLACWVLRFGCLTLQDLLLALHSPPITGQRSALPDHAVARYSDCHPVTGAGPCNRPRGLWHADPLRDIGVGRRLAERDALQLFPDPQLEGAAVKVQWQFATLHLGFHQIDH